MSDIIIKIPLAETIIALMAGAFWPTLYKGA